jgi:hypothetical protein
MHTTLRCHSILIIISRRNRCYLIENSQFAFSALRILYFLIHLRQSFVCISCKVTRIWSEFYIYYISILYPRWNCDETWRCRETTILLEIVYGDGNIFFSMVNFLGFELFWGIRFNFAARV